MLWEVMGQVKLSPSCCQLGGSKPAPCSVQWVLWSCCAWALGSVGPCQSQRWHLPRSPGHHEDPGEASSQSPGKPFPPELLNHAQAPQRGREMFIWVARMGNESPGGTWSSKSAREDPPSTGRQLVGACGKAPCGKSAPSLMSLHARGKLSSSRLSPSGSAEP